MGLIKNIYINRENHASNDEFNTLVVKYIYILTRTVQILIYFPDDIL